MKRFLLFWSLVITAIAIPNAFAQPGVGIQGFVVDAEYRFRPEIQRLMADRALRALPLQDGKLYYVFPTYQSNAALEQLQIRYLEDMLSRRAEKAEAELDAQAQAVDETAK